MRGLAVLLATAALAPLQFPRADGWHAGTTGSRACPGVPASRCVQAWSWTGTVRWRDCAGCLPHRTLAVLPRDGVLVSATVARERPPVAARRIAWPPRIPAREIGGLEGVPARIGVYQLFARVDASREVGLLVFFGRARPTAAQLARANGRLASGRLG
jgi:hypothetical protein